MLDIQAKEFGMIRIVRQKEQGQSLQSEFERLRPRLAVIIAGMGLGSEIDDICQEVYVSAIKGDLDSGAIVSIEAWLIRVAINRCLMEFRRRKRFVNSAEDIYHHHHNSQRQKVSTPDGNTILTEEIQQIRSGLQDMDDEISAVLVLKYFGRMDSTEIANVLDINPSTIRGRVRKGRILLAERLRENGFSGDADE